MEETLLRQLFESYRMGAWDDDHPERIIEPFKQEFQDKADVALLDKIIREHYPLYDVVVDTPVVVEEPPVAVKPLVIMYEVEPEITTSHPDATADTLVLEMLADITKNEPKPKRQQAYGKRQLAKDIGKDLILDFLNTKNHRRKGFKISDIYEAVEWINVIDERTMRRYMEELYKANKVKMWKKPYILPGGQKVYHKVYTSATNPDPNFTLWLS